MQEQPQRRPKKGSPFNWIGPLIFLLLAFGSRIGPIVQNLFAGQSLTLPANIPGPLIISGVVVLALVVSGGVRVVRAIQRRSEASPLTTALPRSFDTPQPVARRMNAPMPPFGGAGTPVSPVMMPPSAAQPLASSPQRLPGPPRFEPVITGKAVAAAFGVGLLVGLVFVLARALG